MLFIFSCGWFIFFFKNQFLYLILKSQTFHSASILTLKTHTHTQKWKSICFGKICLFLNSCLCLTVWFLYITTMHSQISLLLIFNCLTCALINSFFLINLHLRNKFFFNLSPIYTALLEKWRADTAHYNPATTRPKLS